MSQPPKPSSSAAVTRVPLSVSLVEQTRQAPVYEVLRELCIAAKEGRVQGTPEFKRLVASILETADGRDRREPWTTRTGDARPVPKLRVLVEECFGVYADLHWFKLNKITNRSGRSLKGLFPRMAAGLWRVSPEMFGSLVDALLSPSPDATLLGFLKDHGGTKLNGIGVEAFSRFAYAMRRDLYFALPREWADSSGCTKYVGGDLRRYLGLCRNLRVVCDELGLPGDVRASVLRALLEQTVPPAEVLQALHRAIGPSLARYRALDPADAWSPKEEEDLSSLPMEFAARSIRARRGRRDQRTLLLRAYGDRCALTGNCLRDLLEVAVIPPYPSADLHAPENALLLRSDLHTLWDLNLVGVEPKTRRLAVAPALAGTTYEKLAGRVLLGRVDGGDVSEEALAERWEMFTAAHPAARTAPAPPAARTAPAPTASTRPAAFGQKRELTLREE